MRRCAAFRTLEVEPRVSTRLVRPVVRLLREAGAPIGALVHHGVDIDDPDARVPHRVVTALLEQAALGCGDDALGLHAAEHLRPGDLDALEYAAASSATVREAILTTNRCLRLLHDAAELSLEVGASTAAWRVRFPASAPRCPQVAEYVLGILVVLGRRHAGRSMLRGGEARFVHQRPRSVAEHWRILGVEPRFGQAHDALVFPATSLDLPLPRSDPALKGVLERVIDERLGRLPVRDDIGAQVRRLLDAELPGGEPTIEHLAARLRVSSRTLRRRLDELGTSHRDLLADLRRERALEYLDDPSLAIDEAALLLGYSDVTAFHRAFKRWTGMSVSRYRESRRAALR